MPSLRQLEYLATLADTRHFRRAAEKLNVSQPTLSAQLINLEERLGVQLVERSRAGIFLTPMGEEVEAIARRVIRDVQEIRDTTSMQRSKLAGMIKLGLPPTIGPYLLPNLVPKIHSSYPELKLYVREQVPNELPTSLEEGRHDVIIMPLPVRGKDFEVITLFREPLYLTVAADSELANKASVSRKDLRGQSILVLENGHQLREQVDAICEEFKANILTNFEGTSLDTLRQMVAMGMGHTFLPGLYAKNVSQKEKSIKMFEMKDRKLFRTVGMIWRKSSARKREFEQLGDHVRMTVKKSFPTFHLL